MTRIRADICRSEVPSDHAPAGLRISVVIPCFNQGRFLVDCLENLAIQSETPAEVILVNDGSTDEETNRLCARLPMYLYPFPLHVLDKPNGGLSSARNHGISRSTGDVILPLDADDKLTPDALAAYRLAFEEDANADIIYPDVFAFGNEDWLWLAGTFNRWRMALENYIVCSSAIRRRVFDAGYMYDEGMRRGYEDWEFWLRTCVFGPFRMVPLRKPVFLYRKWGFSMLSATNADQQRIIADMRSRHVAAGIWSMNVERRLRNEHAALHRVVRPSVDDVQQGWRDATDLAPLASNVVEDFLASDCTARFLWMGNVASEARANVQLMVNEVAEQVCAPLYAFQHTGESSAYLLVLDRLRVYQNPQLYDRTLQSLGNYARINTQGHRFPFARNMTTVSSELQVAERSLAGALASASLRTVLPRSLSDDKRVASDFTFYLHRRPEVAAPVMPIRRGRVLAIAMPFLRMSDSESVIRFVLEESSIRDRFDKIAVFTFVENAHEAHNVFEPRVDGMVHLGNLGLGDEHKIELAIRLMERCGTTDFLIADSSHALDMIPRLRQAKLPVRITAQVQLCDDQPLVEGLRDGFPFLLASRYANLIDGVASTSAALTASMVDQLYFPPNKIKTVLLDNSRMRQNKASSAPSDSCYVRGLVDWLFPNEQSPLSEISSLFGASVAAAAKLAG